MGSSRTRARTAVPCIGRRILNHCATREVPIWFFVCFFGLFFKNFYLFIYFYFWLCWVFISVRGLSLVAASRGPLFIAVRGPLTVAASLVAEHRLQTHRLSSCGSRAQMLRGMWDLPRPGLEPVSPALAGGFLTTAPPGKPPIWF